MADEVSELTVGCTLDGCTDGEADRLDGGGGVTLETSGDTLDGTTDGTVLAT